MKVIGMILLVLAGVASGCLASHRLHQRVKVLTLTEEWLLFLQTRIRYMATPLPELLNRAAAQTQFAPLQFIPAAAESVSKGLPLAEAVSGSVEKTALQSGFSREDAECLCRIGTELGRTDREGQLAHLTLAAQQIAARRDGAKERAHTLSRLYLTLGGAGGLVAALLVW